MRKYVCLTALESKGRGSRKNAEDTEVRVIAFFFLFFLNLIRIASFSHSWTQNVNKTKTTISMEKNEKKKKKKKKKKDVCLYLNHFLRKQNGKKKISQLQNLLVNESIL